MDALNLFPQHVAIGRADESGKVYMSPEFARAVAALFSRVGGAFSYSVSDLENEIAANTDIPLAGMISAAVAELQQQISDLAQCAAALGELAKGLRDAEVNAATVAAPTDWEHPGKIGASTPNSGAFTALTVTGKVQIIPVDLPVDIKPTGTGLMTIQPATQAGQIDNMELGKTAPQPARVTTLNKVAVTQPATGATLTLADGATLTVPGAGGTLESAAYQPTSAFAARSNASLGAAATDAASTQTLANTLRTVLLSVGIGS